MGPLAVIEHLDVVEDPRSGLLPSGKAVVVNQFVLEIAEEAFDHGVVVAIAFAAHADLGVDLVQLGLVIDADIG